MSPDKRFERLSNLLGSGNPNGGIWFIGLEPGDEWKSEHEIDTFIERVGDRQYFCYEAGNTEVIGWKISSRISRICHQITGNERSWRDYRSNRYQTKEGDFFAANLYPIARPDPSNTPHAYNAWFGYTDEQEYIARVQNNGRFGRLRAFREASKPKVTICHGKEQWAIFKEILELGSPISELDKGKIIEYPGGIFLTPHLSWAPHMPNLRIELLANRARQYWQS